MVRGERQLERRRRDIPVVLPLLKGVGEVAHLGIFRFLVEVLQQNHGFLFFSVAANTFQTFLAGVHAHLFIGTEVVAGMDDDPLCVELGKDVDVAAQVGFDAFADVRRILCNIDRRQRVQCKVHAVPLECGTHIGAARVVERGNRVGGGIELDVDVFDIILCRPVDGVFEGQAAADVDADAVEKAHGSVFMFGNNAVSYSALAPVALTTLPHFSVSDLM